MSKKISDEIKGFNNQHILDNLYKENKVIEAFDMSKSIIDGRFETKEERKAYEQELIKDSQTEESMREKQAILGDIRKLFD